LLQPRSIPKLRTDQLSRRILTGTSSLLSQPGQSRWNRSASDACFFIESPDRGDQGFSQALVVILIAATGSFVKPVARSV
jgi:hypothetical protein